MRRFILTDHAIERYQQRVCPRLTMAEAEVRLRARLPHAERTGLRTYRGDRVWFLPGSPPASVVTKPDGADLVVVTVAGWQPEPEEPPRRRGESRREERRRRKFEQWG